MHFAERSQKGYLNMNEALSDAGASPHLLHTLKGEYLVKFAWDAHGNGLPDTIPDGGSERFTTRLKEARTAFEAAWKADQTYDRPGVGMISVCRGLSLEREEMEKWFQRALTANPDSFQACVAKQIYLYPKWHGSEKETLAFGRQCLRTKNYYSGIPYFLVLAHTRNFSSMPKAAAYLQGNEIAWADVREYYENALINTPTDRTLLSEYAYWCSGVEQWAVAKKHLTALKNKPDLAVFPKSDDFDWLVKLVDEKLKEANK